MADFPYMPLWTDAYLADTSHLTTTEHGAYLLLLMCMWRSGGSLPYDDRKLAKFCGLSPSQWGRIKPTIMEFLVVEAGRVTQRRLQKEFTAVKRKSESQKSKADARWLKTKEVPHAAACSRHMPTDASHSHNHKEEKRETNVSPKKSRGSRLPDGWALPDEWRAWAESEGVPPQHIEDQAKRFADYWHGKAGQGATKADWFATWRNWIRNARGVPRVRAIDGGSHETEQQRAYREARERRAAIAERMDRERGGGA